jgi:hypothetical protein
MSNYDRLGHNYVDISSLTNTLVLSRNEYLRAPLLDGCQQVIIG